MERALEFINYRNLGLDKPQRIVLNYSLEKGKLGGLVTVIGPNNSGKSNVLDGLMNFKKGNFDKRDVTMLELDEKFQNPILKYVAHDGEDYYEYGFDLRGQRISKAECKTVKEHKITKKDFVSYSNDLLIILARFNGTAAFKNRIQDVIKMCSVNVPLETVKKDFESLLSAVKQFLAANFGYKIENFFNGTSLENSEYAKSIILKIKLLRSLNQNTDLI